MPIYVKFKPSKDLENLAYEIIEKARENGKICKGTNETTKRVERGEAKLVVMAEDVTPEEILAHMPILCEEKNIPYTYVSSKAELGRAAGLDVAAASVGVIDIDKEAKNLLDNIIKKIEDEKKQGQK
jgi:large subunit ribosomal protein L7Ae